MTREHVGILAVPADIDCNHKLLLRLALRCYDVLRTVIYMETKNIFLELRKKHGLSQEKMAEILFVTRQAVSRWENGETVPNVDTLKIISKAFDVPIGSLLGLENHKLCLFKQDGFVFSYRVAGILVRDGKVLLQKPNNTEEYAFPGGLVIFGETTAQALTRRWMQETGLEIEVGQLKWVEENLFVLEGKPRQQVCLDYIVDFKAAEDGLADGTTALTYSEDDENAVCFYWVPLEQVASIKVYPESAAVLLGRLDRPVQHLAYLETGIEK